MPPLLNAASAKADVSIYGKYHLRARHINVRVCVHALIPFSRCGR